MKGDARVRSHVYLSTAVNSKWLDPIIALYIYIYIKSLASGEDVLRTTAERYLSSGFKMMAV